MSNILSNGCLKNDRTGIGTLSLFGQSIEYIIKVMDSGYEIPMFTTKSVFFKGVVTELLWFLSGNTNTKILQKQGNRIWDGNTSREALDNLNLSYDEGELGPGYGYQWIHSGGTWRPDGNSEGGVNQIKYVIDELRKNPNSRRAVLNAWSPTDINAMALPPCHVMYVFNHTGNNKLSCHLTLRSNDMFLGHPFNVLSTSILLILISKCVNMIPDKVTLTMVDAHIYCNHVQQTMTQLERFTLKRPILNINKEINEYEDMLKLEYKDFVLMDYKKWPAIKADMAV
jgi:thymidylate synthase